MRDEPAFPALEPTGSGSMGIQFRGLTKREVFAALALQGIIANCGPGGYGERASQAVQQADALMKALS